MTCSPHKQWKWPPGKAWSRRRVLSLSLLLPLASSLTGGRIAAAAGGKAAASRRIILNGLMAHASVLSEAELINLPWRQSSSWGGLPSVPLAEVLKGRGLFPEARSLLIVGRGAEHSLSLPLSRGLESGLLLDGGAGGLLFAAKGAEPLAELERIEIGRFLWSAPGPSPIVST